VQRTEYEDGKLKLERQHAWVTPFNPWTFVAARCNQDWQFVGLSGKDFRSIVIYTTEYVTKKQKRNYQLAPLFAAASKSLEMQEAKTGRITDARERSRRLLIKCVNQALAQHEKSAPEVASWLLGHPTAYTSAKFSLLHLPTFLRFADRREDSTGRPAVDIDANTERGDEFQLDFAGSEPTIASPLFDYLFRPQEDASLNLYDYTARGYRRASEIVLMQDDDAVDCEPDGANIDDEAQDAGIPTEYRFLPAHPQFRTHVRKRYTAERVTCIIGPSWPLPDADPEGYAKRALVCFKPFRAVVGDLLQSADETFVQAFDRWRPDMPAEVQQILANINDIRLGKSQADAERRQQRMRSPEDMAALEVASVDPAFAQYHADEGNDDDSMHDDDADSAWLLPTVSPGERVTIAKNEQKWVADAMGELNRLKLFDLRQPAQREVKQQHVQVCMVVACHNFCSMLCFSRLRCANLMEQSVPHQQSRR
jgi:hypothetical protein